jgi:dGTPase
VQDAELDHEVAAAIRAARARGARSFYEVLASCEGADPRTVRRLFDESSTEQSSTGPSVARRETNELAALFPAADPVGCQWWYTLDSIEALAERVYQVAMPGSPVAFVGAPTVAHHYSRRSAGATAFEVDTQVVQALANVDGLLAIAYDVANDIPPEHRSRFGAVLTDPPWYEDILLAFLQRSLELADVGASILCSLPPRLTRPGIVDERQRLLQKLIEGNVEIVAIERSATRYLVPPFERAALQDIGDFDGRSWRSGDLLHIRKKSNSVFTGPSVAAYGVRSFARNAKKFRVFLRESTRPQQSESQWVTPERAFENTISRRKVDPSNLDWWTSEKKGGTTRDGHLFASALSCWADDGLSLEATVLALGGDPTVGPDSARALCECIERDLGLWGRHGSGSIAKRSELAIEGTTGRPYSKRDDDGYRSPFQRDRDRITWSRGLRQLANKTQVFPMAVGDFLRNRLSHSLEVMQLATTIGTSFGLNLNLIEAGALAHDIGHTPFGHAGESAMNSLFSEIKSGLGFNHYEHGVDVVRWLEDAYQSPAFGSIFGLNITPEVAECIFKHTYCTTGGSLCQSELYARTKHKAYFKNDLSHLEGQAVRIADKVSYLVSDLEDGIRAGALDVNDLLNCELLRTPPIDLAVAPGESLHERFLSQRSLLIGLLMEDIIEATNQRLSSICTLADVRRGPSYTVNHSRGFSHWVDQIWEQLQKGKLHRDARVRMANIRAARVVRELTLLMAVAPQLVEARFREGHARLHSTEYMSFYRRETGTKVQLQRASLRFLGGDAGDALGLGTSGQPEVPIEDLIQAKDYVAGLSDERARSLHHELLGS